MWFFGSFAARKLFFGPGAFENFTHNPGYFMYPLFNVHYFICFCLQATFASLRSNFQFLGHLLKSWGKGLNIIIGGRAYVDSQGKPCAGPLMSADKLASFVKAMVKAKSFEVMPYDIGPTT